MKTPKFLSDLDQLGRNAFLEAVQKPHILVCPQGVVTYTIPHENPSVGTILQQVFDPQEIDGKIREILAVTPDLTLERLTEFGQAIGISITNFERAKPPAPDEDVIF